jgi:hypothetical protein
MRSIFSHPESDAKLYRANHEPDSVYQTLLYTVLQKPREKEDGGVVIALSSSNTGEGVTYVARALIRELAKCDMTSTAGLNISFLRRLHEPTVEGIRRSISKGAPQRSGHSGEKGHAEGGMRNLMIQEHRSPWEASWQYRRDCINLLRSEFDYTIIDCPSMSQSGDLLSIAPFVDGVILVVEANRTRRDQPRLAEQRIQAAGGTLLGYILNKRVYELPRWMGADA